MQDPHADFIIADFRHRLHNRFCRPLNIGFQQNGQLADVFIGLRIGHELFQSCRCTESGTFIFGGLSTIFCNFTRLCFGFNHIQNVTRFRCAVQAENFNRC